MKVGTISGQMVKAGSVKKKSQSLASRIGLQVPQHRAIVAMKKNKAERTSKEAAVVIAAAVEYVVAELCEMATAAEHHIRGSDPNKKVRVSFGALSSALRSDREMH